jgi:hypothetical protein
VGLIFSLVLSIGGVFAFSTHRSFAKKGREEFKTPISLSTLTATLAVSIVQAGLTIYLLVV